MTTALADEAQAAARLDGILLELSRLKERVAALEANAAPQPTSAHAVTPAVPVTEELSEEVVIVLGAAVAAYLGKKAHIRQVSLIGSHPWAQQGRVIVQASHTLGGRAERKQ